MPTLRVCSALDRSSDRPAKRPVGVGDVHGLILGEATAPTMPAHLQPAVAEGAPGDAVAPPRAGWASEHAPRPSGRSSRRPTAGRRRPGAGLRPGGGDHPLALAGAARARSPAARGRGGRAQRRGPAPRLMAQGWGRGPRGGAPRSRSPLPPAPVRLGDGPERAGGQADTLALTRAGRSREVGVAKGVPETVEESLGPAMVGDVGERDQLPPRGAGQRPSRRLVGVPRSAPAISSPPTRC